MTTPTTTTTTMNWNSWILLLCFATAANSFVVTAPLSTHHAAPATPATTFGQGRSSSSPLMMATTSTKSSSKEESVIELKKVLEREYISFFNPMRTEFYSPTVTFDDPLTSLAGVAAYQTNVDMLSGRTLLGSLLFEDASINLHSVTGGEINTNTDTDSSGSSTTIADITTRWTLRFTMKILPWKPMTRFSGISVYQVQEKDNGEGIEIVNQADYWDSINLLPDGSTDYEAVDKSVAVQDFVSQLSPGGFEAKPAAPELPYILLRRGKDYEVRRYPAYTAVQLPYERRDEGFGSLGAFTNGIESPLGPAIMTVSAAASKKTMQWPLTFALPGQSVPPEPIKATKKKQDGSWDKCELLLNLPTKVVAVADFADASMEPVVRKADRELRAALKRDGLIPVVDEGGAAANGNDGSSTTTNDVTFAQYDAIFSMGKRRGEVWIDLKDGGHPW